MPDYRFVLQGPDERTHERLFHLAGRTEAIVRSFDLLRDHREATRVEVSVNGTRLFARLRRGGKSHLEFDV